MGIKENYFFKKIKLEDILELKNGKIPNQYEKGSFTVYGSNGSIGFTDKFNAAGGTIIIGRVGSQCGSVNLSYENCWVTDNAIITTAKEPKDIQFLYYLLKYLKLNRLRIGSGQPLINQGIIKSIKTLIPESLKNRRVIGYSLALLEKKIELNYQMIDTLETIAQMIFKSWFIDFEPFQDGEFIESELGEIPNGWKVISVSEIAEYINGKAFTVKATPSGRMIIKIAELKNGKNPTTKYYDKEVEEENIAYFDDILFAWSASLGLYRWNGEEGVINQHIFKVIPKNFPKWFVYCNLKNAMPWFIEIAKSKSTTMGHIKRSHLIEYKIIKPPDEIINELNSVIDLIYSKIKINNREINILTKLRDLLVPQLISGRLRIKNLENFIEEISN